LRISTASKLASAASRVPCFGEPGLLVAGQADVAHLRHHLATALPAQVARLAHGDRVAAALGLAHHGVGGVLVGLEGFDGVGDEEQFHGCDGFHQFRAVLLHKQRQAAGHHAPEGRADAGQHHARLSVTRKVMSAASRWPFTRQRLRQPAADAAQQRQPGNRQHQLLAERPSAAR
jgi:hypothetical protein